MAEEEEEEGEGEERARDSAERLQRYRTVGRETRQEFGAKIARSRRGLGLLREEGGSQPAHAHSLSTLPGSLTWLGLSSSYRVPWGDQSVPTASSYISATVGASEPVLMDRYVIKSAPGEAGGGGGRKRRRGEEPLLGQPLWQEIRAEGLSCDYRLLFGRAEADEIFRQLEEEVEYFQGEMTKLQVFGKWHDIPRKLVTYGDPELTYTYSGATFSPKPWIPVLNLIRDRVASATGYTFNFVLINRYKDGEDHIGEHRDDEQELVPRSPIASVSFGACRDFVFRHCDSRGKKATRHIEPIKLQLAHGSLLLMKYPTNVYWYHSLPIRKRVLAPRINLTFRQVLSVASK